MDEEDKEIKKGRETDKKTPNLGLYVILAVILIIVAGGAYEYGKHTAKTAASPQGQGNSQTNTQDRPPAEPPSMKGQKFSDTNVYSQAVQIYPGEVSASAKAAMNGWNLKIKTLPDGTTQADLIPVGSEATEGDTAHTFILKSGYKLYFVDLNPNDDGPKDQNTHDDLGISVDEGGIVQ